MDNDIAATARTTASIRAREAARSDALFRDPLAEALAGPEAMAALSAMPEVIQTRASMYTIVRTRVFDDWLLATTGPNIVVGGVSQVVLLGAGFDSRAFRLDWPAGVSVWELDQSALLAAKAAILAGLAPVPRCRRTTVAVDFANMDWPGALQSAGFRPDLPTVWLAEGVLPYLTPAVAIGLFDAVGALSPPGSRLAADFVDEDSIVTRNLYLASLRQLSPSLKGAPFQFGANDPTRFLADHGWSTQAIMQPGDEGASFGRVIASAGPANLPLPKLSFVMARRSR